MGLRKNKEKKREKGKKNFPPCGFKIDFSGRGEGE